MKPKQILLIRHAEKPGNPGADDPNDGPHLSLIGQRRAWAYVAYMPNVFGNPDFIFAAAFSPHSSRPVETVTPLAQAIGIKLHAEISDADFATLAKSLSSDDQYAGKLVLICWHHGKIPALTEALGGTPPRNPWPAHEFDRVWVLTPGQSNPEAVEVKDVPQCLLYGDSSS